MRAVLLVLALGGCLRQTQFQCETDTACGTGGVCESSGFCSFVDKNCDSGRRYTESAGPNAGQCTGGGGGSGGVDSGVVDARPIDAPPGCPATFTTVAGAGAHVYKVIANTDSWTKQQTACRAFTLNAYLMVPDDAAELAAVDAVAGAAQYWVGINDIANEGVFINVLDMMPQTFLPWQPPAPDNAGPGEDCVEAISASNKLNDDRCNSARAAVCECAP
jgi:hypothetical protein